MERPILNLRKVHRSLTIPVIILMVSKMISMNTAYELVASTFAAVIMMFMAISGLLIYIYSKRKK